MNNATTNPSKSHLVSYNLQHMRIVATISQMFNETIYVTVTVAKDDTPHEQGSISLSFNLENGTSNFAQISSPRICIEADELSAELGSALSADIDRILSICVYHYRESPHFPDAIELIKRDIHELIDGVIVNLYR